MENFLAHETFFFPLLSEQRHRNSFSEPVNAFARKLFGVGVDRVMKSNRNNVPTVITRNLHRQQRRKKNVLLKKNEAFLFPLNFVQVINQRVAEDDIYKTCLTNAALS